MHLNLTRLGHDSNKCFIKIMFYSVLPKIKFLDPHIT